MRITEICNIKMGGLPGECPTLMIGSIFFDGHKIVKDPATGQFNEPSAKALIEEQMMWSRTTGLPACVDIVASTTAAMEKYLEFVTGIFDGLIMIDGSDASVKIAGVRWMAEKGIINRAIYNSISTDTIQEELDVIKECGVKTAVALLVDSLDFSDEKKFAMMTSDDGPVAQAKSSGIENILVDPGVIDIPSIATAKEIYGKAREHGYCCGSGVHNALGTWDGLKTKMGGRSFKPVASAVVNALSTAWDGDFALYGPMEDAASVFPAVAMVDAVLAQGLMTKGALPGVEHPLFKIV